MGAAPTNAGILNYAGYQVDGPYNYGVRAATDGTNVYILLDSYTRSGGTYQNSMVAIDEAFVGGNEKILYDYDYTIEALSAETQFTKIVTMSKNPQIIDGYLALTGGTMSGAINMGSQNITKGGTIAATTISGSTLITGGTVVGTTVSGTNITAATRVKSGDFSGGTVNATTVTAATRVKSGDFSGGTMHFTSATGTNITVTNETATTITTTNALVSTSLAVPTAAPSSPASGKVYLWFSNTGQYDE